MNTRLLPTADYLRIKAAFRDLVDQAGGPTRAATKTRTDASYLSRYGNPNESMQAPIDVIMDLEADVNEPVVTRVMAELAGFSLVDKAAGVPADSFAQDVGETAKDAGALLSAFGEALADNKIDASDAKRTLPRLHELQETLAGVEHKLELIESGQVVPLHARTA